jgi:hypothetical protein
MCSGPSLPLKFIPLKQYDAKMTSGELHGKPTTHNVINFAVEHYRDHKKVEAQLDSFGKSQTDAASKVNDFQIYLFKASEKTNVKYLSENPRDFVRYSMEHDLLYEYLYVNGKFIGRFKYKNGVIMDPEFKGKIDVNVK